jgi:hypothetical protein
MNKTKKIQDDVIETEMSYFRDTSLELQRYINQLVDASA